jgi:adenylate cyclase
MALEIERKFLVKNDDYKSESIKQTKIVQGFLSTVPERTVRIRILGDKGFITVKGIGNESGITRFEWEKEISIEDAKSLLNLCESGRIHKTRFNVKYGNHIFEIDEFYDDNDGLVIAEIELTFEEEYFEKPLWLGQEVTGQIKYYNAMLLKKPFKNW